MYSITPFLLLLDPWFIAPFRWLPTATAGYLLGTAILALQCIIIGDLSATLITYLNRGYLSKIQEKMDRNHNLSEQALMQGDKESYKAVNRQGLDAFGYQFSMGAAIFCVSIWPMPFSLAWLHMRFAEAPLELTVQLPLLGQSVHYFASFLLLYIAVRMSYSFIMTRQAWYAGVKARVLKAGLT
ncbi:MAG: hypothetical protein ACD_75C02215G0002 [uncultured bacterium]|nr:MAG: hypothetical protein ACD_75C02215G0002 [uncultured bacterium]